MKRFPRYLVGAAALVFVFMAYSRGPMISEAAAGPSKYIEVCSHGTVYVPPETKFVTCQGRIMRVIAIVPAGAQTRVPSDCNCPKCCDGGCEVTVSCGGGGLCVMYLAC
jgi:hypothetical protein